MYFSSLEFKLMSCPHPGGPGPWFCALLFNILFNPSQKSKKQTHLIAHTLPHLAVDILNRNAKDDTCWVMMNKVGPFSDWGECVAYLNMWTTKTRGQKRRLDRGFELFVEFYALLGLHFWCQYEEKESVIGKYNTHKREQQQRLNNEMTILNEEEEEEDAGEINRKKRKKQNSSSSSNVLLSLGDAQTYFNSPTHSISVEMIRNITLKKVKIK